VSSPQHNHAQDEFRSRVEATAEAVGLVGQSDADAHTSVRGNHLEHNVEDGDWDNYLVNTSFNTNLTQ
jgi:hypothetical protein